jgi:hypothetical protein
LPILAAESGRLQTIAVGGSTIGLRIPTSRSGDEKARGHRSVAQRRFSYRVHGAGISTPSQKARIYAVGGINRWDNGIRGRWSFQERQALKASGCDQASLSNLTPADVYFRRSQTTLLQSERTKQKTIERWRLQHRKSAALNDQPDVPEPPIIQTPRCPNVFGDEYY